MRPSMRIAVFVDFLFFGLMRPARGHRWATARALGIGAATGSLMGAATCALVWVEGDDATFARIFCFSGASAIGWLAAAWVCDQERREFLRGNRGGPPPRP